MPKTYYDLVQEIKGNPQVSQGMELRTNNSQLDKRMAADAELMHLERYVLRDSNNKAVPDIVNITLNRPAVFAANVIASLGHARQQCIVETENKSIDTHLIEDFLNACFAAADRNRMLQGEPLMNPFADVQFCVRGRSARRVLLHIDHETGEVIPDITPWDGRYVYYEKGRQGLKWAAYECIRTKDEIEADYGDDLTALTQPIAYLNQEASVLDVWDDKTNQVWVNGFLIREQPNPYGFCPVVFQSVYLGYGQMLLDRNWQKYEGESIFFLIRDIVPELNRLASILQTLNMKQLKAALQYRNPEGSPTDMPPEYPESADVVSTGKGELTPINLGDVKNAATMLYNMMEKAFQEGSYTDIDVGNVQQPFSAVALITIGENKDMVYMPRLAAKEQLNQLTAEMLIKQAEMLGGTLEVGIPGHKKRFNTLELGGDYSINYKYFVKSPKTDIARMSLAEAAAKWYPRSFIYSEVLQVEDPEGLERDWYKQEAEQLSVGVKMHRIIMSLLEQAEKNNDPDAAREAQILANELGMTIANTQAGVESPATGKIEGKAGSSTAPPVPLLGEGGKVGGLAANKIASNLQRQPKELPIGTAS